MKRSKPFRRKTPRFCWLVFLVAGLLVLPSAGLSLSASPPTSAGAVAGVPGVAIVQLRTLSWSKTSSTGPPPVDDSYPALGVFGTQVTVTGLEQIQGMTQFTYLALTNNTDITDDSLERLKGLTKIKRLNLRGTSITDDGLKRLKRLTDLEQLNLSGTKVTDAGLKRLNTLTSLEELRPAFCS